MRKALLYSLMVFLPCALIAQSKESADQTGSFLKAGAEFSIFNPDYYCPTSSPFHCGYGRPLIKGVDVFADYDVRARWGAEAEARWLRWNALGGQEESTYLIGPHYRIYKWHNLGIWAKFLVGIGKITTKDYPAPDTLKGSMFVYAPGASLEYPLNRKLSFRGGYEVQRWPSFAVLPPNNHGLLPNGFSFGFAYTIHGR